jgi:hypothetical protein
MKEQDLDQLIDSAAAQIVRREPSDAMTAGVMDRVNRVAPASSRPRLVWAGLAAAAALATLVVVLQLQRTLPGTVETPPVAVRQPPAPSVAQPAPVFTQNFVFERNIPVPSITIDPLLSPPPIQVPGLDIEPLHIEPLSASND